MFPKIFFDQNTKSGLTLVEVMIAVGIIMIVVFPLVSAISHHLKATTNLSNSDRATHLAQELMEEIKQKKWDELSLGGKNLPPYTTTSPVGVNTGETFGNKLTYDDIDDYDGLVEQPPRDINNNPILDARDFTRSVMVRYVAPFFNITGYPYPPIKMNPATSSGDMYYPKEIIVTVSWPGASRPVILRTLKCSINRY